MSTLIYSDPLAAAIYGVVRTRPPSGDADAVLAYRRQEVGSVADGAFAVAEHAALDETFALEADEDLDGADDIGTAEARHVVS
jgi:hypothetical protein